MTTRNDLSHQSETPNSPDDAFGDAAAEPWRDTGPSLGGVLAEAAGAYAVWRALPKPAEIEWHSGYYSDLKVTGLPNHSDLTINVKRAWRSGAGQGYLCCSPLGNNLADSNAAADIYALAVVEHEDMERNYVQSRDGAVSLNATVMCKDVYYLPRDDAAELLDSGTLRVSSKGRWIVPESALVSFKKLPGA